MSRGDEYNRQDSEKSPGPGNRSSGIALARPFPPTHQMRVHRSRGPVGIARGNGLDQQTMIVRQLVETDDPFAECNAPADDFEQMAACQGLDQPGTAAEPGDFDMQLNVDRVGIVPALFDNKQLHAFDNLLQPVEVFGPGPSCRQARRLDFESPADSEQIIELGFRPVADTITITPFMNDEAVECKTPQGTDDWPITRPLSQGDALLAEVRTGSEFTFEDLPPNRFVHTSRFTAAAPGVRSGGCVRAFLAHVISRGKRCQGDNS